MTNYCHSAVWLLSLTLLLLPHSAPEEKDRPKAVGKKITVVVVQVKAKGSLQPLMGADVFLRVAGTGYEKPVESDDQGNAEFTNVPHGQASVQATKDGWKTAGLMLTLDDKTPKISLEMEKMEASSGPSHGLSR